MLHQPIPAPTLMDRLKALLFGGASSRLVADKVTASEIREQIRRLNAFALDRHCGKALAGRLYPDKTTVEISPSKSHIMLERIGDADYGFEIDANVDVYTIGYSPVRMTSFRLRFHGLLTGGGDVHWASVEVIG